jgi:pimeloyl-ACP methyl ester carboxylesterase
MSGMVGADADHLDRLAARMQSTSAALGLLGRAIGVALRAAPWFGGVADVFRQRWAAEHARALVETSEFLRQNAIVLRANAQQQRDASGAGGAFCSAPGAPGAIGGALDRLAGAGTPDEVAAVWASLSDAQRADIIEHHPDVVGNLDGIPPADRVAANRNRVHRDLEALIAAGDTSSDRYKILKHLDTFDSSLDPITGEPRGLPQVYLYDGTGEGRLAVIEGDLSTARNVAVFVPGTGASLDNAKGELGRGRNLYAMSEPGTAVVTWIGYDAPDAVYPTQNGQPIADFGGDNAMLEKFADRGSRQLASSLAGLGVSRDANLTVIGHSYGSVIAAGGAHLYGQADNIITVGSPGVGFEHASQVDIDGTFYAMNASKDMVGRVPIFGENPTDPGFGAVRLSTAAVGDYREVFGHSDYFEGPVDNKAAEYQSGAASAHHMAAVISGNPEQAVRHSWTVEERVGDLAGSPWEYANRQIDDLQDGVDLPQPVDDVVDAGQGVVRGIGGAVEWGVEAGVDGAKKLFGK